MDKICNHKRDTLDYVLNQENEKVLNHISMKNVMMDAHNIMSSRNLFNRVDFDYLREREVSKEEREALIKEYLTLEGKPELLEKFKNLEDHTIYTYIIERWWENDFCTLAKIEKTDVAELIGFKDFMRFIIDFINFKDNCNHLDHMGENGHCSKCGKTIELESIFRMKMLEVEKKETLF